LLDSQFAALEEPRADERPIVTSIAPHPREIVKDIVSNLKAGAVHRRAAAGNA
jgi:gluconate kinase